MRPKSATSMAREYGCCSLVVYPSIIHTIRPESVITRYGSRSHELVQPVRHLAANHHPAVFSQVAREQDVGLAFADRRRQTHPKAGDRNPDRKSTRLNSSHVSESRM